MADNIPARIIAKYDNEDLGLEEEVEILDVSEKTRKVLLLEGFAKPYDDTKPRVGKSVNIYQPGMPYPSGRQIFKNDSIYICSVPEGSKSSTSWIYSPTPTIQNPTEWDILVTGSAAQ